MLNKIGKYLLFLYVYVMYHLERKRPKDFGMPQNLDSYFDDKYFLLWKNKFPISYFINHVVIKFFYSIKRNMHDAYWWVKYHTTHKYHLLDLRQPENRNGTLDQYKYGWIDSDIKISFALFNIMMRFVEEELQYNFEHAEGMDSYNECMDELKSIYNYYTIERLNDLIIIKDFLNDISSYDRERQKEIVLNYNELKENFYKKEEEMLIRLIKIRGCMWT